MEIQLQDRGDPAALKFRRERKNRTMGKIIAINCSPRSIWNTATLVKEAAEGARSKGAQVEIIDLYKLRKFTGCLSCFGCKREPNLGKCIIKDGLGPVLEAIREADGLILGTPNYLGDVSAGFRALYERLIFQSLTYKTEPKSYNDRKIPVLLIMTSNAPEAAYPMLGYKKKLKDYKNTLDAFVGETEVFVSGNTLQVSDYSIYDWTMFDPKAKQKRREKVFPKECKKAFELGAELFG